MIAYKTMLERSEVTRVLAGLSFITFETLFKVIQGHVAPDS